MTDGGIVAVAAAGGGGGGGGGIACLRRRFEMGLDAGALKPQPLKPERPLSLRINKNAFKATDSPSDANQANQTPGRYARKAMTPDWEPENRVPVESQTPLFGSQVSPPVTSTVERDLEQASSSSSQADSAFDEATEKDDVLDDALEDTASTASAGTPSGELLEQIKNESANQKTALVASVSNSAHPNAESVGLKARDERKESASGGEKPKLMAKQRGAPEPGRLQFTSEATAASASSNAVSFKVKQLAKSMEDLCRSPGETPTKESNAPRGKRPVPTAPGNRPASKSTSAVENERPGALATKPPPPPVPKKHRKPPAKTPSSSSSHEMLDSGDHVTSPASSEIQSPPLPDQEPEEKRFTSNSLPAASGGKNDVGLSEMSDEEGRYNSLPLLTYASRAMSEEDILTPRAKNTLFPCSRQKQRAPVKQTKSDDELGDPNLSPGRRRNDPSPPGTWTLPDADLQADSDDLSSPLQPPDQRTPDFDCDAFLSETFDFLDVPKSGHEDSSMPLNSWTENWTRSLQKEKLNSKQSNQPQPSKDASNSGSVRLRHPKGVGQGKLEPSARPEKLDSPVGGAGVDTRGPVPTHKPVEAKKALGKANSLAYGGNVGNQSVGSGQSAIDEGPNLFGVVLRRSSTRLSASNRPSQVPPDRTAPTQVLPKTRRPDSLISQSPSFRASDNTPRPSTVRVSSATVARKASTTSTASTLPLTFLPSERPVEKAPGKYVGGRPSVYLHRLSSSAGAGTTGQQGTKEVREQEEVNEFDLIDRAFDFLDNSGA